LYILLYVFILKFYNILFFYHVYMQLYVQKWDFNKLSVCLSVCP